VRVQGVEAGSSAEAAGLRAGDVLLAMDGQEMAGLRAYSEMLKHHAPGDIVEFSVSRGGETIAIRVTLAAR